MRESIIAQISTFSDSHSGFGGGAIVILVDSLGKIADAAEKIAHKVKISHLLKVTNFKGDRGKFVKTWITEEKGFDCLVLLGIGAMDTLCGDDWIKIGGTCRKALSGIKKATVLLAKKNGEELSRVEIEDFICGLDLRHYKFDYYKTIKEDGDGEEKEKHALLSIVLQVEDPKVARKAFLNARNIIDGVCMARDLVNEPANILGTVEFISKIQRLTQYGIGVEIFGEDALKTMGLLALLGVGYGSKRSTHLAVMHWQGIEKDKRPICFVGKGVVFDSGGISIKPSSGMEDMKGDMAGAAAIVGVMRILAGRKAQANVIGIVGLVENMPSGNAIRPGDVLTSLSGQTIEVINTDAEGRLVLADALWYAQKTFNPKFIVDLATLTGAIMVALGQYHAGLFANNDILAKNLLKAGQTTGERLWRMPLGKDYDKMIDSKIADMRNSTGRNAGSIVAAQFLQRFVKDIPWAHLDVAGTAINAPKSEYNQSWGSGFGVRLLDRLVADSYEEQNKI